MAERLTFRPAANHREAVERLRKIRATERALPLSEAGGSVLLDHGTRTPRCYVLLHGLTNCPQQFRALGERLFAAGANVVIPRAKYHGLRDRMNSLQSRLTARDLLLQANTGIELACGLGERVTAAGLSVAGVSVARLAHARTEIDCAVLLAPIFGLPGFHPLVTEMLGQSLALLPNIYLWWDRRKKADLDGPPHVYPRFATRQIAEVLKLARTVQRLARTQPLAARRLVMVLTESDLAINNAAALAVFEAWKSRNRGIRLDLHVFPKAEQVGHDFIDPLQPGQRIERVYPRLIEWMENRKD